ncbi:hypothetical protein M3Y98_00971200 [Aphelenchoides besseyi]|nr:hypothetical protein M3Y98_00971200 [Aphelenchoides besseyi]KAI6194776.1 hypothetical protein M3Y96_01161100 [Aphelenchoides besseyi]
MVRHSQITKKKRESLAKAREVRRERQQEAALQNARQESVSQIENQEPQSSTSTTQSTTSRVEDRELSISERERLLAEREHEISQREAELNQRERELVLERADYEHKFIVLQTQSVANAEKFEQMTEDLKHLQALNHRLLRKLQKSNSELSTDDEYQSNDLDSSFDPCLWSYD